MSTNTGNSYIHETLDVGVIRILRSRSHPHSPTDPNSSTCSRIKTHLLSCRSPVVRLYKPFPRLSRHPSLRPPDPRSGLSGSNSTSKPENPGVNGETSLSYCTPMVLFLRSVTNTFRVLSPTWKLGRTGNR